MRPDAFTSTERGRVRKTPEGYWAFVPAAAPRRLSLSDEVVKLLDEATGAVHRLGVLLREPGAHHAAGENGAGDVGAAGGGGGGDGGGGGGVHARGDGLNGSDERLHPVPQGALPGEVVRVGRRVGVPRAAPAADGGATLRLVHACVVLREAAPLLLRYDAAV